MKAFLLNDWNMVRWLRLLLAVIIGIQAFVVMDTLLGIVSAFLFFQVITNTGCCCSSNCAVKPTKSSEIQNTNK